MPEEPQRRGDPQMRLLVRLSGRPGQCRAQVVVLALQPREPEDLLRSEELRSRPLDQRQKELGVATVVRPGFGILRKELLGVLADRLQQSVARLPTLLLELQ